MKRRPRTMKRVRAVAQDCPFCKGNSEPDYKAADALSKYMTERAKISPKSRTGLCSKHQRRVTIAIRRARHVALLPFVNRA